LPTSKNNALIGILSVYSRHRHDFVLFSCAIAHASINKPGLCL
jgi:hypothetical protein